jgi:hypothetical protein
MNNINNNQKNLLYNSLTHDEKYGSQKDLAKYDVFGYNYFNTTKLPFAQTDRDLRQGGNFILFVSLSEVVFFSHPMSDSHRITS